MLVGCVASHEPALKASFYAVYQRPYESFAPLECADLMVWLPVGCALWRSVGGPAALSEADHHLRVIEFRLRVLAWMQTEDAKHKRNQPKPPEPIPYAGQVRAEEEHARRQAAARKRRGAT